MRNRNWYFARPLFLALCALAVLLLVGCAETPQSTISPKSNIARDIQGLYALIFWAALFVFVAVEGLLIYAVVRFRAKPGQGQSLPPQVHGNKRLEIAWSIAPAIILVVIAVPTWRTIFRTYQTPPPDSLQVQVMARQWWWEFQYPDLKIVTANELHLPLGQPVGITLQSRDVIHSFWVPKLAGKMDVFPDRQTRIWFTPDTPGTYVGQCAELCGVSHANMRLRVVVQPKEEFEAWAKGQQTPPAPPVGKAKEGADLFAKGVFAKGQQCIFCHTLEGTAGVGTVGPNLTHVGSRSTLAAGVLVNDQEGKNLARWLADPPAVKPGALMPDLKLSQDQIDALVVYLQSLK